MLQTRVLILADGALAFSGKPKILHSKEDYGTHALVTQIRVDRPHQHWAYERFSQYGPIAFLPLNSQDFVLVWALPNDEIGASKPCQKRSFSRCCKRKSASVLASLPPWALAPAIRCLWCKLKSKCAALWCCLATRLMHCTLLQVRALTLPARYRRLGRAS